MDDTDPLTGSMAMYNKNPQGFTLIEVVAALAIVATALLGLLRLHLVSIQAADKAQAVGQAVFLAQERMTQALCGGYPPLGTQSGVVEGNGPPFTWQTEVTESPPFDLKLGRVRKLSVDVAWPKGSGQDHVQLTTYVADSAIHD